MRAITAEFAELPWIYFEAPEGALAARYGNPSLPAPQYDLEAARPALRIDTVTDAAWGEPRTRTADENAVGAAPPLPTVGAPVDASTFRFVRDIPAGDAGLVAVRLDEAALAHSSGVASRFGDVRVIDADGRQIPYLVERSSEPLSIELSLAKLSTRPAALGSAPRLGDRLSHRLAVRGAAVAASRAQHERARVQAADPCRRRARSRTGSAAIRGSRRWARRHGCMPIRTRRRPRWSMSLPSVDAKEVLLIVEEGDNTPLPIGGARLLLPAYRMRLFRETGQSLRLAYGRSDLAPPSYDLALLAPRVFGVAASEISPGPERDERPGAVALVSPRLFWGILRRGHRAARADHATCPKAIIMTKHLSLALNAAVLFVAALLVQPHAGGQSVNDRVEIDVVALDERGQPVRGLAASDFTLKEDGRIVDVDSFQEVSALGAGGRADGRTLLLILDDSGVEPQLTTRIQTIARLVVARMGDADTVRVVHLNRFAEANAGGAATALARIAEFRGGARPFGGRETLETSLEKVEKLSQQFEPLEHRRKVIVGIGSPMVFDVMDPIRPTSLIWENWVRALTAASRANSSLYVIDPAGITGDVKLSGSTGLVAQTGGEAFYNSNKFEQHVERIWSEAGHYYLLGYSPALSNRELHRIQVSVGREGVRARVRRSRG